MSSPFQQKFSAKSPLNGNYYSGVDGIKYASPKPGVIDIPLPPKKKEEEEVKPPKATNVPKTKKKFDFGSGDIDTSIDIPESNFKFGGGGTPDPAEVVSKNRKDFTNKQTLKTTVPGAKVEKIEKDKKKYLASFEPGFARDPEGTTTIKEYIRKKEGKYRDRTLYQDQEQKGFTTDGETTLGDWMNVGKQYEK
jgi:hypothetical protein